MHWSKYHYTNFPMEDIRLGSAKCITCTTNSIHNSILLCLPWEKMTSPWNHQTHDLEFVGQCSRTSILFFLYFDFYFLDNMNGCKRRTVLFEWWLVNQSAWKKPEHPISGQPTMLPHPKNKWRGSSSIHGPWSSNISTIGKGGSSHWLSIRLHTH